ncbi:protein tramtrack, alpha isoform-like isoform X3 [Penaeus monodon]|nr:protein tramtrack, alpha isoform-like isoform X3 [Penaeus monodon]XP_037785083.1 protein tramtrack, alpha isoform-like isoform X3 [Penaeus monodon]
MVGSDMQFCLRWNNFGTTMTAALHSLHEGGDFVDVTLAADGVQLKAHKLVLSACSPYFRDILKNNPCQHPVIILRDVPIEDLEAVLAFMYEGQVNVSQTRLHTFMKLAEALQVRGLTDTQTARARVEKEMYQSIVPVAEMGNSTNPVVAAAAAAVAAAVSSSNASAITVPVVSQATVQVPQIRSRVHESPPPPAKRRKSSPTQQSPSIGAPDEDDSLEENTDIKRDIRNLLEVKLEPEEYPEDGLDHEDDTDQPPPPPPEVSFMEQPPDIVVRTSGGATSSLGLPSVFLPQQTTSDKSHQRRNSHEKTSSASLQPEFPQDPSCQNLPYPCPFCEKAYTSWGFRRRHIKGYHTSSPELPCKWCYTILSSHQEWEEHVTRRHNLASGDARNGLLILEEAHMVLQIAQPTRIDSLMELIKNKKDKDGDDSKGKDGESKDAIQSQNQRDKGEGSK